jgi:hypothetical protein
LFANCWRCFRAELDELQKQLDPDSINPNVDYVFFQKVMDDWIANIQGDGVDNGFSEFPTKYIGQE